MGRMCFAAYAHPCRSSTDWSTEPDSAPHECAAESKQDDDDKEEKRKFKSISEEDPCEKKRQKVTRAYAAAGELAASLCEGAKARFEVAQMCGDEETYMLVVERCAILIQKVATATIRNAPSFSAAPESSSETLVVAGGEEADEARTTSFILSVDSEGALLNCADASLDAFAARVEILYALFGVLKTNFDETVLDNEDQDVLIAAFQGDGECDATAAITAVSDQVRTAQFAYGCMIYGDNSDFGSSFVQLEDVKDFIYGPDFNEFDHIPPMWSIAGVGPTVGPTVVPVNSRCVSDNPIRVVVSSIIENLSAIIGHVEDVLNETGGGTD